MRVLFLLLQLVQLPFPTASVTYFVQHLEDDMVVIVSYPAPGKLVMACTILYQPGSLESGVEELEIERHCWKPTNDIADFDRWEHHRWSGEVIVCFVDFLQPDGTMRRQFAYPIRGDS